MIAYKAAFKKKNGEVRNMVFAELNDLPDSFLEQKIIGSGAEKEYPEGMQLVWDLEVDDFRVFNWNTLLSPVERVKVEGIF